MFPRVTHPSATSTRRHSFDLHVLGLPPAFILSQDQTLKLKAHRCAILDVEPCTSSTISRSRTSSVLCFSCRNNKSRKTVKLVTLIIAKAREPICCDHDAETSKPPAYLFRYISMSKIIKTKSNTAPIHKAPRPTTSPLEATSATSPEPHCVSVRRYLG